MTDKLLIGLTGLKGSGKDTAADVLILQGWSKVMMAGPLKDMLAALLRYQGASEHTIDRALNGDFKERASDLYLRGRTPRHAMVTLGTEWGRNLISEDIWIAAAKRRIGITPGSVVVTDVRFPNEAYMVRDLGGYLIRIERPGLEAADHPSENQVLAMPVDLILTNDADVATLQAKIRAVVDVLANPTQDGAAHAK